MTAPHDPRLLIRAAEPFNAEPPADLLRRSFITPAGLFFVRNHGPVPEVDVRQYRLSVGGLVRHERRWSLDDLRARFPETTVVATLQCAGNRRRELMAVRPIDGEIPWDAQAIGNAAWTGVRLRDLLEDAGIADGGAHVEFMGTDAIERHGRVGGFGGSIPVGKAVAEEVLVAHSMNGALLTRLHGFPLRVVVPGYIGARSVKWLASIDVRREPSDNYFQTHSYKLFSPNVSAETADWSGGVMLGEVPVTAAICRPQPGETVPAGRIRCEGYAYAGHRTVARVELSADGGKTWTGARLVDEVHPWAWRFWEAALAVAPGLRQIVVRATDGTGRTQPEDPADIWNFKGYMNSAWNRVPVRAI